MCVVQAYKCTLELVWKGADEVGAVGEGLEMIRKGSVHAYHDTITSLTAKVRSLAGLISAICKFTIKADATASTSTATHQIAGTYDLSSPWFPRKYNKLDLWWSYRLTIPPFNELYERETRTIWCKTVEDHQKSKWKGYGSCVFVLVHPKRHGIHSMSATTLKGP